MASDVGGPNGERRRSSDNKGRLEAAADSATAKALARFATPLLLALFGHPDRTRLGAMRGVIDA